MFLCALVYACVRWVNRHVFDGSGIQTESRTLCHHGYPALTCSAHPALMDCTCLSNSSFSVFQCHIKLKETDGPEDSYINMSAVFVYTQNNIRPQDKTSFRVVRLPTKLQR